MEGLIKDITIVDAKPNDLIIVRTNKVLDETEAKQTIEQLRGIMPNKILMVDKKRRNNN